MTANAVEIPKQAEFLRDGMERMLERARGAPRRSIVEFAEAEIILPDGPYKGERLDLDHSPHTRMLLELIESGEYAEHYWTACVQSGKTLVLLIVLMYYLFELEENVVFGLPTMEIWADKWLLDIRPVIEASKYRDLMPSEGSGARGGRPSELIRFRNGAALKPMSAGGRDQKRSAFTARVIVMTELDKMDVAGEKSRETDPVRQMVARSKAFGEDAKVFGECTVSTVDGRIWSEVTGGSDTRIAHRCPSCGALSFVGREHLTGWREAETEYDAWESGAFCCPSCGERWSESQRAGACASAALVHRGQAISEDGQTVEGDAARTRTLGFRWSASHNLFVSAGNVAAEEWAAAKKKRDGMEQDAELAELELRQYTWVDPIVPDEQQEGELTPSMVGRRVASTPQRSLPPNTVGLTLGADVGKHNIYWVELAVLDDGSLLVPDYGVVEVQSQTTPEDVAIRAAIEELEQYVHDVVEGCEVEASGDGAARRVRPALRAIDSNYMKVPVLDGVRAINRARRCKAAIGTRGRGHGQFVDGRRAESYSHPTAKTKTTTHIGDGLHVRYERDVKQSVVEVNADRWKRYVHDRLRVPPDTPGSMLLYQADTRTHHSIAHHLTAEHSIETVSDGVPVQKFVRKRAANHYLDALSLACVAASMAGLIGSAPAPGWGDTSQIAESVRPKRATPERAPVDTRQQRTPDQPRNFAGPGGAPFFVGDR